MECHTTTAEDSSTNSHHERGLRRGGGQYDSACMEGTTTRQMVHLPEQRAYGPMGGTCKVHGGRWRVSEAEECVIKFGYLVFDAKGGVCDGEGGVYGVVFVADIARVDYWWRHRNARLRWYACARSVICTVSTFPPLKID